MGLINRLAPSTTISTSLTSSGNAAAFGKRTACVRLLLKIFVVLDMTSSFVSPIWIYIQSAFVKDSDDCSLDCNTRPPYLFHLDHPSAGPIMLCEASKLLGMRIAWFFADYAADNGVPTADNFGSARVEGGTLN